MASYKNIKCNTAQNNSIITRSYKVIFRNTLYNFNLFWSGVIFCKHNFILKRNRFYEIVEFLISCLKEVFVLRIELFNKYLRSKINHKNVVSWIPKFLKRKTRIMFHINKIT